MIARCIYFLKIMLLISKVFSVSSCGDCVGKTWPTYTNYTSSHGQQVWQHSQIFLPVWTSNCQCSRERERHRHGTLYPITTDPTGKAEPTCGQTSCLSPSTRSPHFLSVFLRLIGSLYTSKKSVALSARSCPSAVLIILLTDTHNDRLQ